ncbi:MAG: HNH endonuclease [bacterium]
MEDRSDTIKSICETLSSGDYSGASEIARREYPFLAPSAGARNFTETQALRIFVRDGFLDRYSGVRLLFPPVLRVLSALLPKEFPFHRNWKMSETHPAYWDLFPTLDHVVPIARGGADNKDNIVSTSMLRNSAKANWTLEELGWSLHPPGQMSEWDGMLAWFIDFVDRNKEIVKDRYIGRWHRVAQSWRSST